MRKGKFNISGSDKDSSVTPRSITLHDTGGHPAPPTEPERQPQQAPQFDNPVFEMGDEGHSPEKNGGVMKSNGDAGKLKVSESDTAFSNISSNDMSNRRRHKSDGAASSLNVESLNPPLSSVDKSMKGSSAASLNKQFDDIFEDESGLTLIYSRHEKVALKDFSNEVRASLDVESYLKNMSLLLNLSESSVDALIDACLRKMLENSPNSRAYDQAKAGLFTHDYVHQLSRTIQCTSISEGGGFDYDQNWICSVSSVPSLTTRRVCIARLLHPVNLGQTCQEVHFLIVILVPTKEKGTKNELEVARTFGTIFSDIYIRQELLDATSDEHFKEILGKVTHRLAEQHSKADVKVHIPEDETPKVSCGFLRGIRDDLKRRIPHYVSDYKDGVADKKSIGKTISTTFFIYFACLLPCIAFGVLNESNTSGQINVEKVIYSQVFGGLVFALIGGTPQIVLLTTAPLALYTNIIYTLSDEYDLDFPAFFACVGLFNSAFLVIFSVFDLSILMQFSTRSSEEIFALFIAIAFSVDALKNCAENFDEFYCDPVSKVFNNSAVNSSLPEVTGCAREISLLYLLLMLGTLWLGVTLFTFNKTPYLTAGKREILADYALPVAVIIMSFIGSYLFRDVSMVKSFEESTESNPFKFANLSSLPWQAVLGACGLGFCLSLLFFMDQNISAALVNAPQNKMKKGSAYHWDLFVIAAINALLSVLTFPWVHAALPHSPLHVVALADVEERVDQGHIYQIIVRVRETRLTCIFAHILIGLSLLFLSVLAYIPTPVLYGLFLYVAVTSLFGNQMFERIQLIFTEQSAYPPNHYIRRVPQRKIHTFTAMQTAQLLVLCIVGFTPYPYLKMFFPVFIFCLIPFRHKIIPMLMAQKYLKALDGGMH